MKRALSRKNLWDGVPTGVKAALARPLGMVPQHYLFGRRFRRSRQFLAEAEWWPAERARAWQLAELRRICTLAVERTPFYRERFRAVGFDPRDLRDVDDLRGLPTIDRSTLAQSLDEMCAVSPTSGHVDYVATGGTSGAPLRFYIGSERSGAEYAYLVSSWARIGFRLGVTLATLRGRPVPADRTGLRHEYDPLLRTHYYSNHHMADDHVRRYLDHIRGIGPCFLHVYPSSVAALARFVRRTGYEPPANVRGILAGSENVHTEQRRFVSETLPYPYFSWYGLSEKVVLAAECERSTHYHVWPTYGVFELLDRRGQPVTTPGERGEIVGTGFLNHVVPFIRYRTGDFATYIAPECRDCGRAHPLVADIRGHRVQEVLVAADGSLITWTAMNVHDDTFENVRQFQFYQDTAGRASLKIVPAPRFSDSDRGRIQAMLRTRLEDRLVVDLQLVDDVALTRTGKSIYVDQRTTGIGLPDPESERSPGSLVAAHGARG